MKKGVLLTVALVVAQGCSAADVPPSAEPAPTVVTDGATPEQLDAFRALEATTGLSWSWVQHAQLKTPMHLSAPRTGKPLLRSPAEAVRTTIDLLTEHKALFRMREPAAELSVERTDVDELGMTHARFQQTVRGVPVAGAELMAHYDRVGRLTSIDANYVPGLDAVDVSPSVTAEDGLAKAQAHAAARSAVDVAKLVTSAPRLVIYASNEHITAPKLAYEVRVRAMTAKMPALWVVTVDAKTGEVLHAYNDLQNIQGSGQGVLGDTKQLEISTGGDGFVLTGTVNGLEHRTMTAQQQEATGVDLTSTDSTSWDTGVTGQGAAVDAHFFATKVSGYYKNVHQRNGIDGAGSPLLSTVHFSQGLDNAFWDPQQQGMFYGDGAQLFRALSAGLDVVAHEFTHGVTGSTSNLTYENQSGALNEAVSDIFGCFIEHSVNPDPVKNWQLGEQVTLQGGVLRDMKNPSSVSQPQPASMSTFVNTQQDNGGVHVNSGIINNAAYLMTMGGTNPDTNVRVAYGIGWEKSEKVWFRANTKYFMAGTDFGQAAQALLQAAQDVGLTANEKNIVDCAFKAVGVAQGACATIVDPTSTTPAPTGDTTTGTPGGATTSSGGDTGDDDTTTTTTSSTSHRRRLVTSESSGCNAAGGTGDLGGFGLLVAAAALVTKRRRRAG